MTHRNYLNEPSLSQSELSMLGIFFPLIINLYIAVGVIKIKFKVSYGLTFGKYRRKLDEMIKAGINLFISLSAQPEFFQNVRYASPLAGAGRPACYLCAAMCIHLDKFRIYWTQFPAGKKNYCSFIFHATNAEERECRNNAICWWSSSPRTRLPPGLITECLLSSPLCTYVTLWSVVSNHFVLVRRLFHKSNEALKCWFISRFTDIFGGELPSFTLPLSRNVYDW